MGTVRCYPASVAHPVLYAKPPLKGFDRMRTEFPCFSVQEIMSYIKGSKESMLEDEVGISKEQYVRQIGLKRAPNFDED